MDRDDRLLRAPRPESLLAAVFLALIAWAPFPHGSTPAWAELALGAGLGTILLAWSGLTLTGLATAPVALSRIVLPALFLLTALAWALAQAIDLAAFGAFTGVDLSGFAHPIWASASSALAADIGAYISVDPESTRRAVFVTALSAAAFFLALQLGRDRERAQVLLAGFAAIAALYAGAVIAAPYVDIDVRSILLPPADPLANAGNVASFLALGALASLGLLAETIRQSATWDRGARAAVRTTVRALAANLALLAAAALVLTALLLAQPQSGLIVFLFGILALIVALVAGKRATAAEASGQRAATAVLIVAMGIAAAFVAVPLQGAAKDMGERERAALTESVLRAIESAPLTGQGFGAFESYYPLVADGTVGGAVREAHNDVLETVADLGVPAGLALMAAPVLLAGMCFAGCVRRRRDRVYPAIAFAASAMLAVNALVASDLQVPAIAITYAALLGLGVAQSWRTSLDALR